MIFALNWQCSASSPLTCPHFPYLWLFTLKNIPLPLNNIPHLPFLLAVSSKSLVDRSRFQQKKPASQHFRKEPAKNKFLVNFFFELTAQHLFSSDLPPPPKSLVYTRKALLVFPPKIAVTKQNPAKYPINSTPILQIIG